MTSYRVTKSAARNRTQQKQRKSFDSCQSDVSFSNRKDEVRRENDGPKTRRQFNFSLSTATTSTSSFTESEQNDGSYSSDTFQSRSEWSTESGTADSFANHNGSIANRSGSIANRSDSQSYEDDFACESTSATTSDKDFHQNDIVRDNGDIENEEDIDEYITKWKKKIKDEGLSDETDKVKDGHQVFQQTPGTSDDEEEEEFEGDAMKRYKIQVMRKLLAEFNLEETIEKYRRLDARHYVVNPKDFSYDCCMDAQIFRERIQTMTGTEKIRINDPFYHEKMRRKYWKEYETRQDNEEKAREEAERERMRRLAARGIISVDELRNDKVLSREYKRDNETRRGNRKHAQNRKSSPQRVKSAPQTQQHNRVGSLLSPEGANQRSYERSRDARIHSAHNATSRLIVPDLSEIAYRKPVSTLNTKHSMNSNTAENGRSNNRRPHTAAVTSRQTDRSFMTSSLSVDPERYSVYTSKSYSSSRPSSRTSRVSIRSCRYEHPVVQQMREEETLDGLYRLAEKIIPEHRIRDSEPAHRELTEEERIQAEEDKYKKGGKMVVKLKL